MWLTYLDAEYDGDTYFPEFDPNEWQEVERWSKDAATFVTLERR
jgi:dihydrofolate reductase